MRHRSTYPLAALLSIAVALPAFTFGQGGGSSAVGFAYVADKEGDPGQPLYKSGYSQILAEQWAKARKTFADLLKQFPRSAYADDARYWSAYALMHTDRMKALQEYRQFINRHPKSNYLGDAVADLGNLEREVQTEKIQREVELLARQHAGNDSMVWNSTERMAEARAMEDLNRRMMRLPQTGVMFDSAFQGIQPRAIGLGPSFGNMDLRGFAMSMKRLGWRMHRTFGVDSESGLDKQTRLRLEALSAIGHGEEDDRGFTTLKDVALDRSQPAVLRIEAMDQLTDFTNHDPASIFINIARTDSSEEIQSESLDHLRACIKDKDKSVQTLATLYHSIPSVRGNQRSMILFEVADIGNDPAVEFLSGVAKGDSSYDLRSEAVYYLGNIGGEKARAVLYDVLLNK